MKTAKSTRTGVLILVLLEDGIGGWLGFMLICLWCVLILVLLEDGIGANSASALGDETARLNPCFTGRWYRSVLLEDGIGDILVS